MRLFLTFVFPICFLIGTSWAQPKIKLLGEEVFNFGRIYEGEKPTHRFKITNAGKDTLKIDHVTTPCGCATARLENYVIAPRDTGTLWIEFNSARYSGDVQKSVIIVSNDLSQRDVFVRFKVNVLRVLESSTEVLYFGQVPIFQSELRTFRLRNNSPSLLTITSVTDTSRFLEADISALILASKDTAVVTAWVKPKAAKKYQGTLEIRTEGKFHPVLQIPYFVQGIGE